MHGFPCLVDGLGPCACASVARLAQVTAMMAVRSDRGIMELSCEDGREVVSGHRVLGARLQVADANALVYVLATGLRSGLT